jgi:hypothetical protein
MKINQSFCLFHAAFLLVLLINGDDGGDVSSERSVNIQRATGRYITERITLHNHLYENPKSGIAQSV